MSSPAGVRQRPGKDAKRPRTPNPDSLSEKVANVADKAAAVAEKAKPYKPVAVQQGKEWDYKLAITVITVLAFVTRFWGIRHPDQVVFDEVHFGKVRNASPGLGPPETNVIHSLRPTTCRGPTSSTFTRHLESSSSHSRAGS